MVPRMSSRARTGLIVAAAVGVVAVAAGGWWFLRDDAPEEADLSATASSLAESETTTGADGESPDPGATAGIAGTWTVDDSTGEFDFESATGTFAGFRVQEELASIGSTTAVGRTGDVDGTVVIEDTTVTSADVEVDLRTLTTDDPRRDGKVQEALETGDFPTATFTLTEPIDLGEGAASGDPVQVDATGDLTIHGVTREVEVPLEAQLVDGTVIVVGSVEVAFSDYDVEAPTAPVVLSVSDVGTMEFQLLLTRS